MNYKYFMYLLALGLFLPMGHAWGMMHVLPGHNPALASEDETSSDEILNMTGHSHLSGAYATDLGRSIHNPRRLQNGITQAQRYIDQASEQLALLEQREKKQKHEQQHKEVETKRAAATSKDGLEPLTREMALLKAEISEKVNSFIEFDIQFAMRSTIVNDSMNSFVDMRHEVIDERLFSSHRINYFQKALGRLEEIGARSVELKKHTSDRGEALHTRRLHQSLILEELLEIEKQKQNMFSEIDRISKKDSLYDKLAALEILESNLGTLKAFAFRCPNLEHLKKSCKGKVHPICSPELEDYRKRSENIITIRIRDLKLKTEEEIKAKRAKEHEEREERLNKEFKQKLDKLSDLTAQKTRPVWKVFGVGVATVATIALLVKSYFWLRGKMSVARA
ncbi:MAG: hypothetical protein ACHQVS_01510 [Candidatus Babeliales bacterium]